MRSNNPKMLILIYNLFCEIINHKIVEKLLVPGLFKNAQMRGAQKTEPRGVYEHSLSGAVCSATLQMSVFQQPRYNLLKRDISAFQGE
jgi:hypothetical protein